MLLLIYFTIFPAPVFAILTRHRGDRGGRIRKSSPREDVKLRALDLGALVSVFPVENKTETRSLTPRDREVLLSGALTPNVVSLPTLGSSKASTPGQVRFSAQLCNSLPVIESRIFPRSCLRIKS